MTGGLAPPEPLIARRTVLVEGSPPGGPGKMKELTEKDLQAKEKLLKRPIAEDEKVSPPIFGTYDQYHLLIEKFAIPGTSGNGVVFLEEESIRE